MPWNGDRGAGFTSPGVDPWLPVGDHGSANVADQRADPRSILNLCRDLIELRRRSAELRRGRYRSLPAPEGVWAWTRGEGIVVALNLADAEAALDVPAGAVAIGTDRDRDGERVGGRLELSPWEGAVVAPL